MSLTTEQLTELGYTQAEFEALSPKMQAIVLAGIKADKTNAENEFRRIFSMGYVSNASWNQEMVSIAYLVNKHDKIDEVVRVIKLGLELGAGFEICLSILKKEGGVFEKFDSKLTKGLISKNNRPE